MQTTYSSDSSLTPAHTYTSSPASSFEGSQSDRLDVEEVTAILRDAIVMQERSIRSLAGRAHSERVGHILEVRQTKRQHEETMEDLREQQEAGRNALNAARESSPDLQDRVTSALEALNTLHRDLDGIINETASITLAGNHAKESYLKTQSKLDAAELEASQLLEQMKDADREIMDLEIAIDRLGRSHELLRREAVITAGYKPDAAIAEPIVIPRKRLARKDSFASLAWERKKPSYKFRQVRRLIASIFKSPAI